MFQLCAVMLFQVRHRLVSGLIPTHSATLHELLAPGTPLVFFGLGCIHDLAFTHH